MPDYTAEQETIVKRVLSYKSHQYYEILSVTKTSPEGEIKKSYRKLSLKLHPDKNPHPRSSEAFKIINKAWEVLSDPEKKRIFDQTGVDPDSRGAAAASGFSGFSNNNGNPFARAQGSQTQFNGAPFDDDIFNLFFGGGRGGAQTFSFGSGNGFTFHLFGGGQDFPFFQANTPHQRQRRQPGTRQGSAQQRQTEETPTTSLLIQLLPLLLFFIIPLITSLFGDSEPAYSFSPTKDLSQIQHSPNYAIPYYVAPITDDSEKLSKREQNKMGEQVEQVYIQDKRSKCSRQRLRRSELIEEAQGWFFTDEEKLKRAKNYPMPDCHILEGMNLL